MQAGSSAGHGDRMVLKYWKAENNMNLREAADTLCVHHNTAKYRLGRIQELTGRNLRSVSDLIELLVAIELQEKQRARS
ncbi:helix-turn-helix domain-containing protein [Nocardia vinacea]|uniref:helix-turn-helix domain-containing protein n=1 Tax=Nocardia vinacea TaxID=96468 RepID=UPI0034481E5D